MNQEAIVVVNDEFSEPGIIERGETRKLAITTFVFFIRRGDDGGSNGAGR